LLRDVLWPRVTSESLLRKALSVISYAQIALDQARPLAIWGRLCTFPYTQ
jgi:hypothetical protein